MSDWASRRKAVYLGLMILVLTAVSFGIFWKFWYKAPTCSDKLQNGEETGVDCGGSCSLVCSNSVEQPIIRWDPRLFEITPGLWSAIVYVENPNISTMASYLPYTFTIYDQGNNILATRTGATVLPKNKTVGIFEGSIMVENGKKPRRAVFELGNNIIWNRVTKNDDEITITHSPLLRQEDAPRVEANVKNNGVEEIKNIELIIAIFDGSDNAIAASRTFVDKLSRNENTNIFFTWPRPFDLGFKVCEKPSDVVLLLDRSGSMASVSVNPPEPLSAAKEAAISFIKQLNPTDKVSIISFATQAKTPIELALTSDFASAEQAVRSIDIEKGSTQYTNIYEALHSAWQELSSQRSREEVSKVAVLLTDGVATSPRDPSGGKKESDDIKYAESVAMQESANLKKDNITIYTIGLGKDINETFLRQAATNEDNYFFAPSAENLKTIYSNISSRICKEIPARIEITYKILDTNVTNN